MGHILKLLQTEVEIVIVLIRLNSWPVFRRKHLITFFNLLILIVTNRKFTEMNHLLLLVPRVSKDLVLSLMIPETAFLWIEKKLFSFVANFLCIKIFFRKISIIIAVILL